MEAKPCAPFLAGCCPFEAFYVRGITRPCPGVHDKAQRDALAGRPLPAHIAREAQAAFRALIRDTDQRVETNQKSLTRLQAESPPLRALSECERLIGEHPRTPAHAHNLLALLRIHGQLIQTIASDAAPAKVTVCEVCAAFKDTKECKHSFCSVYKTIRNLSQKLAAGLKE